MITVLLLLLVGFDIAIVYFGYKHFQPQDPTDQLLADIHDERESIARMKQQISEDLLASKTQIHGQLEKVRQYSSELEADLEDAPKRLKETLKESQSDFYKACDTPLQHLSLRQSEIEGLIKKMQSERKKMLQATQRAESVIQALNHNQNWDEIVDELQTKKYETARGLIAQGVPRSDIMQDLGLTSSELQLL